MKKLSIILLMALLAGCEKDIDIELDDTTEKIVVDATIENGVAPRVILSRSLEYFIKIDPNILGASFVRNAKVVISDGLKTHQLAEDSISNGQGTTIYYYTLNPLEPQTAINRVHSQSSNDIQEFILTMEINISINTPGLTEDTIESFVGNLTQWSGYRCYEWITRR